MKDNSPVYNPGTSKDPLIIFSPETFAKSKERIKKNTSETPKTKSNIKTVRRNKFKRYIMKNKKQEELESSDSSDDENISMYKVILLVYFFAFFSYSFLIFFFVYFGKIRIIPKI